MTRPAPLLAALTLLLAGCPGPEQEYVRQRVIAAQQPPTRQLGFGLHLGASRQQVARALDSRRRRRALQVRVFTEWDTFRAPLHPVPLFEHDTLVGLQVSLPAGLLTKPLIVGLLDSLRGQYGSHQYRPATGDWYWFSGNTEIDYGFSPLRARWRIAYTYLPLPSPQAPR